MLQVVLSACSSYFQKLLMDNPCKHPTIILPYDICFNDLKFIIEFVYRGEIDVSQAELQVSLMRIYCVPMYFMCLNKIIVCLVSSKNCRPIEN